MKTWAFLLALAFASGCAHSPEAQNSKILSYCERWSAKYLNLGSHSDPTRYREDLMSTCFALKGGVDPKQSERARLQARIEDYRNQIAQTRSSEERERLTVLLLSVERDLDRLDTARESQADREAAARNSNRSLAGSCVSNKVGSTTLTNCY